jgi:transposase, IS5 family
MKKVFAGELIATVSLPDMLLFQSLDKTKGGLEMGFKEYTKNMSFTDLELRRVLGSSRTQKFLADLERSIDWKPIETMLIKAYPVGKSEFGNRAYPPLMLLKALLIQKWFGIDSDPELENQVNDRLSFKVFIGLPLRDPSPDHSIICRFRERVGKEVIEQIHHELLMQFKAKGFSIASGMAVDARLVKSASRPVSGSKLDELKAERTKEEEAEKPVKFRRDIESDWTVKHEKPCFGMKEHAAVDVKSGLVLCSMITKASEHDSTYLPALVIKGTHGVTLPEKVYADKGYHGEPNRRFLWLNGIRDGIMRKDEVHAKLTEREIERNRKISRWRYRVEQYFGLSALAEDAGKARFVTLAREGWNKLLGAIAFNLKRVVLCRRVPKLA